MRVRPVAIAAFFVFLTPVGWATVPTPETKSTTAQPVAPPHPSGAPTPPTPPDPPGILDDGASSELSGVGQDITIPAGTTHDGDVTSVYGHVKIDGHVNGDVTVVAGSLDVTGTIEGNVTGVASRIDIDEKSRIEGDLTNVAGSLRRNGATVQGHVVNIPLGVTVPSWGHGLRSGWSGFIGFFFMWKLFALFLFFVCALILSALVPDRIRLVSEEAPTRLFSAFIFGLVGYVVFVFAQMFLAITLIGIPLVFLLYLVFVVLKWLAMCGIFHQIGSRMGRALGRDLSLLGAILLGLLPFALLRFVPFCVGFSIWFLVEILAFGYLILTRVGTRGSPAFAPYPAPAAPAASTVPPAPPGTITT